MLFGLWNDACLDQDWDPKDDATRAMVTREALGLDDSADVPSWSALNDNQITAIRKRLGELAANLDAALETPAARQRRQSLWSIEASSRAMCSLGPVEATCSMALMLMHQTGQNDDILKQILAAISSQFAIENWIEEVPRK